MRRSREDSTPNGGGYARSTGKSIEELKKVTPCARCVPEVSGKKIVHSLPEGDKEEIHLCTRKKEKVVVFRGEENLMAKDEGVSNYPIVEGLQRWFEDSRVTYEKFLLGMRFLDCCAAKSLCGAKQIARLAQTCCTRWEASWR